MILNGFFYLGHITLKEILNDYNFIIIIIFVVLASDFPDLQFEWMFL